MGDTGTCLPPSDLIEVARAVVPDVADRIGAAPDKAGSLGAAKLRLLVQRVHAAMGTRLGEEASWVAAVQGRDPALARRISRAFRPQHPVEWMQNPRFWLSSVDIEQVLKQYDESHGLSTPHRFRFVGVFPRDFARRSQWSGRCVSDEMCSLSVASLRSAGCARFGIVFNMDESHQRGSHWMACFGCVDPADRRRFGVFYYDSVGHAPPKEVQAFMQRLAAEARAEFGENVGRRFAIDWNRHRRQYKNTECGVYAIYFIVACLTTRRPFAHICEAMGNDDAVHKLRTIFFRSPRRPPPGPAPAAAQQQQQGGGRRARLKGMGTSVTSKGVGGRLVNARFF
jgi:hypothetical protein